LHGTCPLLWRAIQAMSESKDISPGKLYAEKVLAEIEAIEREFSGWSFCSSRGNLLATVLLVKGQAGPAEQCGGPALSGPDGDAATKALRALGFAADSDYRVMSRPLGDAPSADVIHSRLMLLVQVIDPLVIIALDSCAAADLAGALEAAVPPAGIPVQIHGRTLLVLSGLEDSLRDERSKRVVWEQLKQLSGDSRSD